MTTQPVVVDEPTRPTAVIGGTGVAMTELPAFFDRAFGTLPRVLAEQGVRPISAAFAHYLSSPTEVVDLEVGFVVESPVAASGDVVPSSLPGGRIARTVHVGPFDGLGSSWAALVEWAGAQGLQPTGTFWEVYLTEPTPDGDPSALRTELDLPVI